MKTVARARCFWMWLTTPSVGRVGRDVVGAFLLGQGIIRAIDGRLFHTLPLEFAPSWAYAIAQIAIGAALLLTGDCQTRHSLGGRLIASLAAGFCVLLAVASYPYSATSAWGAMVLAWICTLEAGARDCQ